MEIWKSSCRVASILCRTPTGFYVEFCDNDFGGPASGPFLLTGNHFISLPSSWVMVNAKDRRMLLILLMVYRLGLQSGLLFGDHLIKAKRGCVISCFGKFDHVIFFFLHIMYVCHLDTRLQCWCHHWYVRQHCPHVHVCGNIDHWLWTV